MDFVLVILFNTDYTNIESLETRTIYGINLDPLTVRIKCQQNYRTVYESLETCTVFGTNLVAIYINKMLCIIEVIL